MASKGKRKKEENQAFFLSKGIIISPYSDCQKEKRKYTLLLKGLLVYLIVMGAMGCFLSSLDVGYSAPMLNVTVFLSALFCSTLYYNKTWEKIGYIILLAVIVWFGVSFRNYINSGFYAIANDISERAALFFDTSAMRSYGEQVGNRYVAVTVSACYIGSMCCVLANIMISRRMRYQTAAFISIAALLMPLYLELEPAVIYVVMFLAGIISVYIIRGGGHYRLTQNNNVYEFQTKERKISYVYSARPMAGIVLLVFIICAVLVGITSIIYPKEQFRNTHAMSALKKSTMDTVENISILGMMGLFNFYPNTGGLTSGTLGGVSSVRLDFETDLTIEFAPYSDERLYLKTFVGGTYLPYSNKWSQLTDISGEIVAKEDETAALLKRRYEEGGEYSARGIMKITNVAAPVGVYLPYYSLDTDKLIYPGREQEYTYYPRVYAGALEGMDGAEIDGAETYSGGMDGSVIGGAETYSGGMDGSVIDGAETCNAGTYSPENEQWLYVPRENREVIAAFVRAAGLHAGSAEEAVRELAEYFQENIPYTLRPGLTPYKKDFVNYFLAENKRGYCAHYASAATLIFRYLGIPARYVEGYAVDPSDIAGRGVVLSDGNVEGKEAQANASTLAEADMGYQYEQYYDGYSPLGAEAVVSVDATDANAHAWVEVYDDEYGWVVAEVTPVSDEEEPGESLWQRLMNFLIGNQASESEEEGALESGDGQDETGLGEQARRLYVRVLWILATLFLAVLIGRVLVKKAVYFYNYRSMDRSGKLIVRYQNYISRIARKNQELTKMVNYEEQIAWLVYKGFWKTEGKADGKETAECVRILEKAGFSGAEVSEEEFERVVRCMG